MTARPSDPVLMAGWLFADLLLVLTVMLLGTQADPQAEGSAFGTTSTSPATSTTMSTITVPSATTSTTVAPTVIGVDPTAVIIDVAPDRTPARGSSAAARARVLEVLQEQLATNRQAAIVLTFGVHPADGEGQKIAGSFNGFLQSEFPDMFGRAAMRTFDYKQASGVGAVRCEIYFLYQNAG